MLLYQVSLPESGFFVLDAVMQMRQHVQARREELEGGGDDREFTLLRLSRISDHSDDVTTSKLRYDRSEGLFAAGVRLGVGHHLK
jgi:hypothetical protein